MFSVLTTIAAWLSFKNNKPILAGIFATLSLIKPSLTIIPIGLLFILYRHKTKGIIAFLTSSLLFYLPPTFLLGWWLPNFLAEISRYVSENRVGWSIIDVGTIVGMVWLFLSISLLGLGLYKKNNFLTLGAALALNAIFVPHTADYDLVAFILLLVHIGFSWLNRDEKKWLFVVLFFSLVWFPWISLLLIIISGVGNAVEVWYRLIWLTYPIIILFSSILTDFSSTKLTVRKLLRIKNVR